MHSRPERTSTAMRCSPPRPSPSALRRSTCVGRSSQRAAPPAAEFVSLVARAEPQSPVHGAVNHVVREADIVCTDGEGNELDVLLLGDREQLVCLRRFALEALSARGGPPDMDGAGARTRQVDLLVYSYPGALDSGDVRPVTPLGVGRTVYARRVVGAEDPKGAARGAVRAIARAEQIEAVALPAPCLSRNEAVAQRYDRGRRGTWPRSRRLCRLADDGEQRRQHGNNQDTRKTYVNRSKERCHRPTPSAMKLQSAPAPPRERCSAGYPPFGGVSRPSRCRRRS